METRNETISIFLFQNCYLNKSEIPSFTYKKVETSLINVLLVFISQNNWISIRLQEDNVVFLKQMKKSIWNFSFVQVWIRHLCCLMACVDVSKCQYFYISVQYQLIFHVHTLLLDEQYGNAPFRLIVSPLSINTSTRFTFEFCWSSQDTNGRCCESDRTTLRQNKSIVVHERTTLSTSL